jgi:hypothetical protein
MARFTAPIPSWAGRFGDPRSTVAAAFHEGHRDSDQDAGNMPTGRSLGCTEREARGGTPRSRSLEGRDTGDAPGRPHQTLLTAGQTAGGIKASCGWPRSCSISWPKPKRPYRGRWTFAETAAAGARCPGRRPAISPALDQVRRRSSQSNKCGLLATRLLCRVKGAKDPAKPLAGVWQWLGCNNKGPFTQLGRYRPWSTAARRIG